MKLVLTMDLDNAAFEGVSEDRRDGYNIGCCLRDLASKIDLGMIRKGESWAIRNPNGNRVGVAEVKE